MAFDPNNPYDSPFWKQYFGATGQDQQYFEGQNGQKLPNPNYKPPVTSPDSNGGNDGGGSGGNTHPDFSIPGIPDWLKQPALNETVSELRNQYKNAGKSYDVTDEVQKYLEAANMQFGLGLQAGNNAASEQSARAYQSGVAGPQNNSATAAQLALPSLQSRLDAEAKAGSITASAAMQKQQAKAALASAIAQARNQYADVLANWNKAQLSHQDFQDQLQQQNEQFNKELQFKSTLGGGGGGSPNTANIIDALTKAQNGIVVSNNQGVPVDPNSQRSDDYIQTLRKLILGLGSNQQAA